MSTRFLCRVKNSCGPGLIQIREQKVILRGVATLQAVHLPDRFVCVNLLDARLFSSESGDEMPQQMAVLREYAAQSGYTAWLERSATRIAERVASLERELRDAPDERRAELQDMLRTSRTTLVILWRRLEGSLGLARRLAAQSEQPSPQSHLRLVK